MTLAEMKEKFIKIVKEDIKRDGIDDLLNYLDENGFYECPASTKYHGSYAGGLMMHSLNVYYELQQTLKFIFGKDWQKRYSMETVAIVSLFHDLCKVGKYTPTIKNVKNKETGTWDTIECYEFNNDALQMGHSALSMHTIEKFMTLTDEEAQAIYWHMGAFDVSQYSTASGLFEAYSHNTLAMALHLADMIATHVDENEHFKPIPYEE